MSEEKKLDSRQIKAFGVQGYRRFEAFKLSELSRVNVVVGENDSGKSTLLEALDIGLATVPGEAFKRHLERRGEVARPDRDFGNRGPLAAHAFRGHSLGDGATIKFEVIRESGRRNVDIVYTEGATYRRKYAEARGEDEARDILPRNINPLLEVHASDGEAEFFQLREGEIGPPFWIDIERKITIAPRDRFRLLSIGPPASSMNMAWRSVALRRESFVLDALRRFSPVLEGINFFPAEPPFPGGEFRAKLAGQSEPVPLGSLGGGSIRLVQLAIYLAANAGDVILIDELEAGLHYRRMPELWRMLIGSAEALDLQVVATTHSLDCLQALGAILTETPSFQADVSLHRVDPDATHSVDYSGSEVVDAIRFEVEVR